MAFEIKTHGRLQMRKTNDGYYQKGVDGFISQKERALHSAANWRLIAFLTLLLTFISFGATVYFASRSTLVPYIVEVDEKSGAVISTSKILDKSEAGSRQKEYFIWQIIRKVRTLPRDIIVYESNWTDAYAFLDSATSQKMNDMAIRENHKERLEEGHTTMLSLKSITPLSGREDTFNIRWIEVSYDGNGKKLAEYELESFFSVELAPLNEKTIYVNPLGIKVKDFSMSQVTRND